MSDSPYGADPGADDAARGRRRAGAGFDWRSGVEQISRLGEELRALGGGAFEAACERAGLVSRERFEVQAALLRDALARLEALEARVAGHEAGGTPPAA